MGSYQSVENDMGEGFEMNLLRCNGFKPCSARTSDKCSLSLLMHQQIFVIGYITKKKGEKSRANGANILTTANFTIWDCSMNVWSGATADSTNRYSLKRDFFPHREEVNKTGLVHEV